MKLLLSLLVGINHLVFPIIGQKIGLKILANNIIDINIITVVIFFIVGLEMIISNEQEDAKSFDVFQMFIFAVGVSIDSFVIGITYQQNTRILLPGIIFMLFSGFITYIGLKIGQYVNKKIGDMSKKIGGLLIILAGLYSLFV